MLRTVDALAALFGCVLALLACDAPREPGSGSAAEIPVLVLLTVDTLRADHLGAYGSDRGLTPNLDAFAAEGLVFESAYAPTPFTVPSLVSLHTGRHPLELGLRMNTSELTPEVETLAEVFVAHGWHTAAVVSNYVLHERSDLAQGFEIYDDTMVQLEAVRRWPERIAADTTDAALRILDLRQRDEQAAALPLFLWVHYQDPHGPYTPPQGWRERHLAQERARYAGKKLPTGVGSHGEAGVPRYQGVGDEDEAAFYHAGYDGEIAYLDQEIGRLLEGLRERGLAERIVFAADHGEAMGENDLWFAHGNDLTDGLVRVPLIAQLPGTRAGRRPDAARLADLYPTLLSAVLGAPAATASAGDPRDLLAPDAESGASVPLLTTLSAYPHRRLGIVTGGYKLILTLRDNVWTPRLYRQGDERVDLAAPAPQIVARLRERLWELREQRNTGEPAPFLPVSDQARERLEALGYVAEPDE